MAELADALDLGSSGRKAMGVRPSPFAPRLRQRHLAVFKLISLVITKSRVLVPSAKEGGYWRFDHLWSPPNSVDAESLQESIDIAVPSSEATN